MRAVTFVSFLFLISMLGLSTNVQVLGASEAPQAVTKEEVNRFMEEYQNQYMKMDLDAFMALFSKEAVENRMYPYSDIRVVYGKCFDISDALQYNLKIDSIQTYTKSAFVSGQYELIQSLKGVNKRKVFRGKIQWNLIRENGSLKIKEMNYGRDYSK